MEKELPWFDIEGTYGGNQDWLKDPMMHLGGCGALAACDLCIYLAKYYGETSLVPFSDEELEKLSKERYIEFSNIMKPYLHPRWKGINTLEAWMDGFQKYLDDRTAETGESPILCLRALHKGLRWPLAGDRIMDATARLLAPRRSTLTPQRPVYESEKSAAPKKNRKKSSKEEHVSRPVSAEKAQKEPVIKQESPVSQETAHKKSKKKKKSGKAQTSALKQEVVKQQPVKAAAPAPKKGKKNASQPQKDKKRRDRGPRGPVEPMKSGQTKDSTEQKSLMKPFYLSF